MIQTRHARVLVASAILAVVTGYVSLTPAPPTQALPSYSLQYGVDCSTCHTVAPELNDFGRAFLNNHFNWPSAHKPQNGGACPFPISGLTKASSVHDISNGGTITQFDNQRLFASNGFTLAKNAHGGYFADYFLATNQIKAGGLGDAYIVLPIDAARHSALSVSVGQNTPLSYQYDVNNSLTFALPAGLSDSVHGFAFNTPTPMVRLEYANGLGNESPDGNYIALGVPFEGTLAANSDSRLYDTSEGYFIHAYMRRGQTSVGGFGYIHTNNSLEGILLTYDPSDKWHLLGAVETGSDASLGVSSATSLQADYIASPDLALSARLDTSTGAGQSATAFPVATITYYPFRQHIFRLAGETVQQKASRSSAIYLLVQL